MTSAVKPTGPSREEFSERLLKGSVKKSYAPVVDIDWDAPLDPDKFYLPPRTVSLYGTPMWDEMTRAQRIELSRQELVNTLSAGIWFENILNQALLRKLMHTDPTSRASHYALTELGDETRHMVMFGKAIERVGAKPVRPRLYHRIIINTLPFFFRGSVLWVAALIGEEIFDSLQRQMMDDPELQPIIQRLMRIHVTEEARHIQFARDGLRKRAPQMRRPERWFVGNVNGLGGWFFRYLFTNPIPYRAGGPRRQAGAQGSAQQPASPRSPGSGLRSAGRVPDRGRSDGPDRASRLDAHQVPVIERCHGVVIVGPVSAGIWAPSCSPPATKTRRLRDPRPRGDQRGVRRRHRYLDADHPRRRDLPRPGRDRLQVAVRPVDTGPARPQGLSRHLVPCGGTRPRFRPGWPAHRGDRRRRRRRAADRPAGQIGGRGQSFPASAAPGHPRLADAPSTTCVAQAELVASPIATSQRRASAPPTVPTMTPTPSSTAPGSPSC